MFRSKHTKRFINYQDATRDVVFLLQERRITYEWYALEEHYHSLKEQYPALFDQYTHEDVCNRTMPHKALAEMLITTPYAIAHWQMASDCADHGNVWYSREEAEEFAKSREHYKWPLGWRVYGVCAAGELVEAMNHWDESKWQAEKDGVEIPPKTNIDYPRQIENQFGKSTLD